MKNVLILISAVVAMATASVSSANPMTLCAKKGANGYILYGHNATTTDWAANKAIGEAIGDGKCQSGWTLEANMKSAQRSSGGTSYGTSVNTEVSSETSTVSAGRMTSPYRNGTPPVVLKGTKSGANDKWRLVSPDGNGGGVYKVVRPGNTSRSKGDTLLFTAQMLKDRDRNGNCTTNSKWCRNLRYGASKDVTKETTKTTTYRTKTVRVQVCPHSYNFLWRNMFGQLVAKVEQDIVPCRWKTVSSSVVETMTQIGHRTYVSNTYIK